MINEKVLRIGTDDNNIYYLDDENGYWRKALTLFDGYNDANKIANNIGIKNAEIHFFIDGINKLKDKGFLLVLDKKFTNEKWFERYRSNIFYFNSDKINGIDFQNKLNKISVLIIGVGGGGFTILSHLVSLGVENITVIDFDKVDLSNISRQVLWGEKEVSRDKIDVAEDYFLNKNSKGRIRKLKCNIESVSDIQKYVNDVDWVFSCADDPPYKMQRIVNKACYIANKPVLFSFCQKNNGRYFFMDPAKSGCVDCLFVGTVDEKWYNFILALKNSNFVPQTSATSYTISLLCSIIIQKWIILLQDGKFNNWITRLDFDTLSFTKVTEWYKQKNCPTCGDNNITDNNLLSFFKLMGNIENNDN
ncbi:ThiF family adenylyltransferase [Spiroplasma endosymbiont of Aspidapion aeneum]|uniref:HesA/MoeB/ThiF family protein n=1 Tax=Spiroplasma endosymbiont of Aspidapion aeneum TaxID=3066276 RepID=UPI00313DAF9E